MSQKSECANGGAKSSIFIKEYKPDKKKRQVFTNYKTFIFIVKTV